MVWPCVLGGGTVVAGAAVILIRRWCAQRARGDQDDPLIVDTDVGLDDVTAIILLAQWKGASLKLVTTVHGCCHELLAGRVMRRLLAALGCGDVKVVRGAPAPRGAENELPKWLPSHRAEIAAFPGRVGLPADPAPKEDNWPPSVDAAADAILLAAQASPQPVTIVAMGPLTNVARAAEKQPEVFLRHVRRVVFAADTGKARPFNVKFDPEAMEVVLWSGVPIELIGNRCRPVTFWEELHDLLHGLTGSMLIQEDSAPVEKRILRAMPAHHPENFSQDPIVAAYIIRPEAFSCEDIRVMVEPGDAGRFLRVRNDRCGPTSHVALEAFAMEVPAYAAMLQKILDDSPEGRPLLEFSTTDQQDSN